MIKIYIGSALEPKEVIANPNDTLKSVYTQNNLTIPSGAVVTHNSSRLGDLDLDKSLADLDIKDFDLLTITEKISGA